MNNLNDQRSTIVEVTASNPNEVVLPQTNANSAQSATLIPVVVRTQRSEATLSEATLFDVGLFVVQRHAHSRSLIEADPLFAQGKQWLSSEHLLVKMGLDPGALTKRLGDGFYEQRQLSDQLVQLTGRLFLPGYSDRETEYRALMDNSISVANSLNLVLGSELSIDQMAQLPKDIVWLVEKAVKLSDGSTAQVLAPQLYVRVRAGSPLGVGAILSGGSIELELDTFCNSGTIIADTVNIKANTIENSGRIFADSVSLEKTSADSSVLVGRERCSVNPLTQQMAGEGTSQSASPSVNKEPTDDLNIGSRLSFKHTL